MGKVWGLSALLFGIASARFSEEVRVADPLDSSNFGSFGSAVALDGDFAVVGADRTDNPDFNEGAAFIFERDGEDSKVWKLVQELVPSQRRDGDSFGSAVAIDGVVAVVSSPAPLNSSPGSVFIFKRQSDGTWKEIQKLASARFGGRNFGQSLAMGNGVLLVTETANLPNGEIAPAFTNVFTIRTGERWEFTQSIEKSLNFRFNNDPMPVAFSGGPFSIVPAKPFPFIFQQGLQNVFSEQQELRPPASVSASSSFGVRGVAIDGFLAAVGDETDNSAFVFEFDEATGVWEFLQKLTDPEANDGDGNRCGPGLAIEGEIIAMGCSFDDTDAPGYVAIFERRKNGRFELAKRVLSIGIGDSRFGEVIAIDEGTLLVGVFSLEFATFFSTPEASECSLPKTKFTKGNLVRRKKRVKAFDRCAELCRSEAECEVFTHDSRRNRCFLRRGNVQQQNDVNSRFTSGPRFCPETLCGAQFQRFRSGVEIRKIKGIVDPKECQNLCVLHVDCEEWTFDSSDDECFLRQGAILETDPSGRFFAGTKECAF